MMKTNYLSQKISPVILFIFISFQIKGQDNYTVSSIPHQSYIGSLIPLSTSDDMYSGIMMLPFSFDFYGNVYNQVIVSTNGYIDFRTNLQNTFSPWSFNQTIPNVSFPVKNAILGCYHDLYNNAQGILSYGIYGNAPYRKFVFVFNNQPQYSCGEAAKSSFQMILHETSNIIDVQIIDRQVCASWQAGVAVSGLINETGTLAITPPGRNTGAWTAHHEGWRYSRAGYYSKYSFVKCDVGTDGLETFDLEAVQNDLYSLNPSSVAFFQTLTDAQTNTNPLSMLNYTSISNPQTVYANVNGQTKEVILSAIDCSVDIDSDTVATNEEDVNDDTNLANDDTDGDGLPNYLDNDDDGDLVLTNEEYIIAKNANTLLDSDSDGILNYLDNDDDGDGTLTFREDYNDNGNPADDDLNANGIPDYLDNQVTLGVQNVAIIKNQIELYPNPTASILNIENNTGESISEIMIYSINGVIVKQIKTRSILTPVLVSDLQNGLYLVKIKTDSHVLNYKFIKK